MPAMQRGTGDQGALELFGFQAVSRFEARQPKLLSAVSLVPNHRKTGMTQMNPDLVVAIGEWLASNQGVPGEPFLDLDQGA